MSAYKHDIVIEQGAKFELSIIYTDDNGEIIDISGFKARMAIRSHKECEEAIDEFDEENGITLSDIDIKITINADVTAAYDFHVGVYDLKLLPDGDEEQAIRLIEGMVKLEEQVTE